MASIFGLVLNNALRAGVLHSGGTVTMKMLNELSDASSIGSLPHHLIPQMRIILYNGLHNIMILSLVLMLISWGISIWAQRLEKQRMLRTGMSH